MLEIRRLDEQFEAQTVLRLRAIQASIASLPFKGGAGRYYAKELIYSIEAGLLLASLHIISSLLELFVRDLLISVSANRSTRSDVNINDIERKYEDESKPLWTFSKMLDALSTQNIIGRADVDALKSFYRDVRIPLYHGLTRRFVRIHDGYAPETDTENSFDIFLGRTIRAHRIEDHLEESAISLLEVAASFMVSYSVYFET